jgi:hypothetical protein
MVGWTDRWVGGLLLGRLKRATKHRLRKGFNYFKIMPLSLIWFPLITCRSHQCNLDTEYVTPVGFVTDTHRALSEI